MANELDKATIQYVDTGPTQIAYRKVGKGPALVFFHGWPLNGQTYRHLVPQLAAKYTLYLVDSPGLGATAWKDGFDFGFTSQAKNFKTMIDQLKLKDYSIVAHDTGASIGRLLAILDQERVTKLVIIGTEIPGHRPPFIELYQGMLALPFAGNIFQLLGSSDLFLKSPMGFGGVFYDTNLINEEFKQLYIAPLRSSERLMEGASLYLRGVEWDVVDRFEGEHANIRCPVLLIWGEDDPTFPVDLARKMSRQFNDCRGFKAIANAKLFVHEEKPSEVADAILTFMTEKA